MEEDARMQVQSFPYKRSEKEKGYNNDGVNTVLLAEVNSRKSLEMT